MKVTINSIAKKANVSPAAVSLALHHKKGVGQELAEKIRNIANELGYASDNDSFDTEKSVVTSEFEQPRMSSQSSIEFIQIYKHGLILNDAHKSFIADYMEGISTRARLFNFTLDITTFHGTDFQPILDEINTTNNEGFIILATELSAEDITLFRQVKKPMVFIDACYDYLPFNFIDMNNTSSVFKVMEYFHAQGFQRIGLVQSKNITPNFMLRESSFKKAVEYHHMEYNETDKFIVNSTYEGAYNDMLSLLETRTLPPALFCVNDIIALGCMNAFKEKGIQIPKEVSIIGFDNLIMCEHNIPSLTSVNVSKRQIGEAAVDLIKKLISSPDKTYGNEIITISGYLVERNSVLKSDTRR